MADTFAMAAVVDHPPLTLQTLQTIQTHTISRDPSSLIQYASSIADQQSLSAHVLNGEAKSHLLASLARFLLFLFTIIPAILFWLVTFTTITLPTWLFTLFSTSLTFTMNATTLSVYREGTA